MKVTQNTIIYKIRYSHKAISCSNLYATCSAFSLRRRSNRSSRVSIFVGGGVSSGSYETYMKN